MNRNIKIIESDIESLIKLFETNSLYLIYDNSIQEQINLSLTRLAENTGVFDSTISKERKNLENFYAIDKKTKKKIDLVNGDTIDFRIRNVLSENNMYSCLKALALSNKCCHGFDNDLKNIKEFFCKYFNILFNDNINNGDITFIEDIKEKTINNRTLSDLLNTSKRYDLSDITDDDFEYIFECINNKESITDNEIKYILDKLHIKYENDNITNKFDEVCNNSSDLLKTYLFNKYNKGVKLTRLRSRIFYIKDCFISMIGQLLINEFDDVFYELVDNPSNKDGFSKMLIIDDKDLSYYIEVHMPDWLSRALIRRGLKYEEGTSRTTLPLGSSAVYYRDNEDIERIVNALREDTIRHDFGERKQTFYNNRARIISRDYVEESEGEITPSRESDNDVSPSKEKDTNRFSFIIEKLNEKLSIIEEYLISLGGRFARIVKENRYLKSNDSYQKDVVDKYINKKYMDVYDIFDNTTKEDFINYYISNSKDNNYDKGLLDFINLNKNNYNIDLLGYLIINSKNIIHGFISSNYNYLDKMLDNNNFNKDEYNDKLYEYIEEYSKSLNDYKDRGRQ